MSKTNGKIIITALVILITVAAGVHASPYFITSPEYSATSGQFYSDADNFLHPRYWADMDFDKWYGVLNLQADLTDNPEFRNTRMMQAGFAARFGDIYTAFYYGGNAMVFPRHSYRIEDNRRVYHTAPQLKLSTDPRNEFSFLLGVADMGFRLSFMSTHRSFNMKDIRIGSGGGAANFDTYREGHGSIYPEFAWGMARELTSRGIMPEVIIGLDFFRDYQKYNTGAGEFVVNSDNHTGINLLAKSGGFSFVDRDSFEFGVDLWYDLGLQLYNSEYSVSPGDIRKIKGANVRNRYFDEDESMYIEWNDLYEISYNEHSLTPYFYTVWTGEKISLSAELGLGFGLEFERFTEMDLTAAGLDKGDTTKITTFIFNPTLDLGMRWAIVPDKFFFNAGTSIGFFRNVEGTEHPGLLALATMEEDEELFIDNTFGAARTTLSLGFTFFPIPNLGFQAMSGVDISTNNISVFDPRPGIGLAVFSKILVTLKF